MAADFFLELDGIKGESQDAVHKDKIDVLEWNWGMRQTGTFHQIQGGGAGRSEFKSLIIKKHVDKASCSMMYHAASGKQIAKGSLIVRKSGGQPLDYMILRLAGIMISGISTESKTIKLVEHVGLEFAVIEFEYKKQNERGLGIAAGNFSWRPLAFDRKPLVDRLISPHKAAFIAEHIDDARVVSKKYGIPAGVILAQAAVESGWGAGVVDGAWFNVKGKSPTGKTTKFTTHEHLGGADVVMKDNFRAYSSFAEAADDYARVLSTAPAYKDCFKHNEALKFVESLRHYATNPNYVDDLKKVINANDLDQYDEL